MQAFYTCFLKFCLALNSYKILIVKYWIVNASGAFGASALYLSLPPVTVGSGRVGLTYESLVKIVNEKIYFIWKLL